MTASAGAWYRVGAVNVVSGQQAVTGVGSNWQNDVTAIAVGDIFTLDAKTWYEVIAVNSDTSIALDRGYEGSTQNSANYAIVRNTSGTILTRIAGQIAVQFNQKQLFLDELRTWLNSDNEAEELTDSHGVKKQLKTPAQMVRDHENKLAEIDAIHPYPWAIRKAEFEAMRAANNEKYEANGFVHMGRHRKSGGTWEHVNEGLSTSLTIPNTMRLGWAQSDIANAEGRSKQLEAVINIAGILSSLSELQNTNKGIAEVKLPPAEDGTRTYDSSTGESVTHATPALAFASETATNKVVTDRVDMWGFEAFLREINDNDPFVYKNGLTQSLATEINGVPTVSDNVRPITYFAWYEGDTTSRGKGVNWQTATESERIAIASDPDNNIYFDDATGNFYQWCVRGRSFAGIGNGDWDNIDCIDTQVGIAFRVSNSNTTRVKAQGVNDLDTAYNSVSTYAEVYVTPQSEQAANNRIDGYGAYVLRGHASNNNKAVDNKCYYLVCGTEDRLNKGGHHPHFNPLGASSFTRNDGLASRLFTSSEAPKITSKYQCFNYGEGYPVNGGNITEPTVYIERGVIGGRSGRPDGRVCDAIYASGQGGVCRDMRYSAHKLTAEDFAKEDLKIKSGEYRGREQLTHVNVAVGESNTTTSTGSLFISVAAGMYLGSIYHASRPNRYSVGDVIWVLDSTGLLQKLEVTAIVNSIKATVRSLTAWVLPDGQIASPQDLSTCHIIEQRKSDLSVAGEFTHTEVIGDPANILLCDDLKDGWVGSWNGFIPDGGSTEVQWNLPLIEGLYWLSTDDSGLTWQSGNPLHWFADPTKNESVTVSPPAGRIIVGNYTTKARMTEKAINREIYSAIEGIGHVYASCRGNAASLTSGELLGFSLTGDILKGDIDNREVTLPLNSYGFRTGTKALSESNISGFPEHPPISLTYSNETQAFKALNYNVAKNQQGFINYAYAQLTYDATAGDWGDDGKIHIIDNQTTMPDENGHTNLVGMAQCVEPIGWLKNDK